MENVEKTKKAKVLVFTKEEMDVVEGFLKNAPYINFTKWAKLLLVDAAKNNVERANFDQIEE